MSNKHESKRTCRVTCDAFQLNMLLKSLWHLTISSHLNQHGVWKKLLAWQIELSFFNSLFGIPNQNKNHCREIVFGKTQDFKLHFLLISLLVEFNYKSDSTRVCLLSIWCILFRVHVMNVDRTKQRMFMSRAVYQPDKLERLFRPTTALKLARRMKDCNHNAFCLKTSSSVRRTFPGGEFDLSCHCPSRMPSSFVNPQLSSPNS